METGGVGFPTSTHRLFPRPGPGCPDDGRYFYNTLVALDATGALRAVYHKAHLFGTSPVLDQPPTPSAVTFDITGGGLAFGLVRAPAPNAACAIAPRAPAHRPASSHSPQLVCFDVEFAQPLTQLLHEGVSAFAVSSMWVNAPPLFSAIMLQQAWCVCCWRRR